MIPTTLNLGAAPNDGTGDPVRTIFQAINANFAAAFAAAPKCAFDAARAPAVTDDYSAGYTFGSLWLFPDRGMMWRCTDPTPGGAKWVPFGTMDHPGYRPDIFYAPQMASTATANIAVNTLYAFPVPILFRRKIKNLHVYVPTGVAATCRLGIYAHDHATKLPGALVAEGAADVDVSGGAAVGTGFAGALPELIPGIYWLASCWSAVCAPSQVPTGVMSGGMAWMWGSDTPDGLIGGTTAPTRYTRTEALTYVAGSPFFPSEFGPGTFGTNTPGSPLIAWRCE